MGFHLLHFILLFVVSFGSMAADYLTSTCNNATTYAESSRYASNLNRVMDYLLQNGSQSGFSTTSYGQSADKVYGLLQCVGNMSAVDCFTCSQQAKSRLEAYCGNDMGGRLWMESCFLRYDNSNFLSRLDTDGKYFSDGNNVIDDVGAFKSNAFSLFSNLSKALYEPPNIGFATGWVNYTATDTIYALVQCWRDLSIDDCRTCLVTAMQGVESCCSTLREVIAALGSCTFRYAAYPFFEITDSSSPEGSPTSTPTRSVPESLANRTSRLFKPENKSSKALPTILGLVGGLILALVIGVIVRKRKVTSAIFGKPETIVTQNNGKEPSAETGFETPEQKILFRIETLTEATRGFCRENKLGHGGFGIVYKGITRDGALIAVKKLTAKSRQVKEEFTNEVKLVANVQHRNLVKLLGCCVNGAERLLVYEYLPNNSLDKILFDPEKRRVLDWTKRYNIIIGIARGLLYLHQDSQLRIIHRDIKSGNILLDDKFNPKIADFGMARLFPNDETHVQTRVAGTYGYMAPEYAMRGQLSSKADVYSFGVLILEIVSGRKNNDIDLPYESQSLLEWAWTLYKRGQVLNMVDSVVTQTCSEKQVSRCIQVGLVCTQADATLRPLMHNVYMMISSSSVGLPHPMKPGFVSISQNKPTFTSSTSTVSSSSASSRTGLLHSANEASITEAGPR